MCFQYDLFIDGLIAALRSEKVAPNAALLGALRWHGIAPGTDHPLDLQLRLAIQRQYGGVV